MLAFSIDYYGIFFGATQSVELFCTYLFKATRIGIEPTTSAVTGRRSNQLSHRARHIQNIKYGTKVDLQGLEPGTDRL